MTKELKSVLNPKEGYMIIPRQLAKSIIDQVNIEDAAKLYYYLLLSANYAKTKNKYGILQRAQTDKSLRQIALETNSSYEHLRYLMKQLEDEELVTYQQIGIHRRIILPRYEEHCGRRVRIAEQADVPETDYEEARKAFAHLSLKDWRAMSP